MNILGFKKKKDAGEKIVMVTCYDAPSAAIVEKSKVDCILVGDSVSMVVHGFPNTTYATMDMMVMHVEAVARGNKTTFIIGDMPFLSNRISPQDTIQNAGRLIKAGAHAVKIEGADGNLDIIRHLVDSGIPVMGHLGLTPQSINQLGGNKVQARSEALAEKLLSDALALQHAGVFATVLECVPSAVAQNVTNQLNIPTIGIGAGPETDGQVLVWHDFLGFQNEFSPKFLKRFFDAESHLLQSINQYADEVVSKVFPSLDQHCYH